MNSVQLGGMLTDQSTPPPTPDLISIPTPAPAPNIANDPAPDSTPTSPRRRPGILTDQSTTRPTPDPISVPTPAPASNITSDPAPDSTPTSPRPRPPDPGCNRLHEIFPLGLDSDSTNIGDPSILAAQELYDLFIRHRGNPHAQRIVVKSAWYGKQVRSVQHEFMVLHIEDPEMLWLRNWLVVDRIPASNAKDATSLSLPLARDSFRVAYDGDLEHLLTKSCLTPYLKLEEISFPQDKPLHLHELVTVVHCISKGDPRYNPFGANCYWFAGLIWNWLPELRPTAEHKPFTPVERRGRLGFVHIGLSPSQVQNASRNTANRTLDPKQPSDPCDFTPNPPKRGQPKRPPGLAEVLRNRFRGISPRGLENTSTNIGQHSTYAVQQFYDLFERQIDNPHARSTVVKSAWYGRQTESAQHEFIVLHVEDLLIPGLRNCLVVGRDRPARGFLAPIARDTFRVACDGDLHRLLRDSQLTPHLELEEIAFLPDKPLFLHELVILVHHISEGHRRYIPIDTNCYWFSGLIWECLRNLHPTAQHKAYSPAGRKGKFGFVRTVPNPIQVRNVLRDLANYALDSDESETELEVLVEMSPMPSPTSAEPDTRQR